MGRCRYCEKSAGFMRSQHRLCADRHAQAQGVILRSITAALDSAESADAVARRVKKTAKDGFMIGLAYNRTVLRGMVAAVDAALDDHVITSEEEERILELCAALHLTRGQMQDAGLTMRLVKGAILHDILDGKFPEGRVNFGPPGNLPFKFQKSEKLIWMFQDVGCMEKRTRREFKGGTTGISVRVARGVYLRKGGFRGQSVERKETVDLGYGLLAITTKHVYFSGDETSFRIPHDKIVTVKYYADAVEIVKDGVRAKPQIFMVDDPWFACNLIQNATVIE